MQAIVISLMPVYMNPLDAGFKLICFHVLQGKFLEKIKSEYPGVPCFLFGHSTGGAVVLKVMSFIKRSCHSSLSLLHIYY